MSELRIARLVDIDDFRATEKLQRLIWPGSGTEVVPMHMLLTIARNGGIVLGAWADDKLVGFLFGFLGTDDASSKRVAAARLKHASHQLGVHPKYRDRNIGSQLKLAQRDAVLKDGVRLATWTYDPLETRNANLNLRKLGGIVRKYKRDYYGEMDDELNAGLPSDRFIVEWWLTSNRVKERVSGKRKPVTFEQYMEAELPVINSPTIDEKGFLIPSENVVESVDKMLLLVQVPMNFQQIKAEEPELALRWRLHSRSVFESTIGAGFIITDYIHKPDFDDGPTGFYVLSFGEAMLQYDDSFSKN